MGRSTFLEDVALADCAVEIEGNSLADLFEAAAAAIARLMVDPATLAIAVDRRIELEAAERDPLLRAPGQNRAGRGRDLGLDGPRRRSHDVARPGQASDPESGVAEEAGFAYKDRDAVVDTLHRLDLSRRVVSLTPIGNIKG